MYVHRKKRTHAALRCLIHFKQAKAKKKRAIDFSSMLYKTRIGGDCRVDHNRCASAFLACERASASLGRPDLSFLFFNQGDDQQIDRSIDYSSE